MRLCLALALAWFAIAAPALQAQPWPVRPVKLVVGFPPGGAADFVARTPGEVVQRIFAAAAGVLSLGEVKKNLAREGTESSGSASPADFAAFIAAEAKLWTRLVRDSGAKLD